MGIARLQESLDQLLADLATRHPDLKINRWSHSLGEANALDGWSMGFVLDGLACPIECEISLATIHSRPGLLRARAEWLRQGRWPLEIWDGYEVPKDLGELDSALRKAIHAGPVQPTNVVSLIEHSTTTSYKVHREVRESLSQDEKAVYQAWFAHLRQARISPLILSSSLGASEYHPHTAGQRQDLARLLMPGWEFGEALVSALFNSDDIPPELQGPGLERAPQTGELFWDSAFWRDFYARHPRGHGRMSLSPVGLVGDRAALLIYNQNGGWGGAEGKVKRLGHGLHCAAFQRQSRDWVLTELRRFEDNGWCQMLLEGEMFLHFAPQARLSVLQREASTGGTRLHLRLEPYVGQSRELQLMDASYLRSNERPPFDCPQPALVVPYLWGPLVLSALEKAFA